MDKNRLRINLESVEIKYLKMLCAKKGITVTSFLKEVIKKAINEEEDMLLAKKAANRLHNLNEQELVPIKQAIEDAGWNTRKPRLAKRKAKIMKPSSL
jgi:predicted DNA-binding protein